MISDAWVWLYTQYTAMLEPFCDQSDEVIYVSLPVGLGG